MIEAYAQPDVFKRGLNAYLEKYAYGTATSEEFSAVMTAVSGKPVDDILRGFVNQPGAPLVDVSLACQGGRTEVTLRQERLLTVPESGRTDRAERWHIPFCATTAAIRSPSVRRSVRPSTVHAKLHRQRLSHPLIDKSSQFRLCV